jgi:hypothetical protein
MRELSEQRDIRPAHLCRYCVTFIEIIKMFYVICFQTVYHENIISL